MAIIDQHVMVVEQFLGSQGINATVQTAFGEIEIGVYSGTDDIESLREALLEYMAAQSVYTPVSVNHIDDP